MSADEELLRAARESARATYGLIDDLKASRAYAAKLEGQITELRGGQLDEVWIAHGRDGSIWGAFSSQPGEEEREMAGQPWQEWDVTRVPVNKVGK